MHEPPDFIGDCPGGSRGRGNGATKRNLIANETLYQLSYDPTQKTETMTRPSPRGTRAQTMAKRPANMPNRAEWPAGCILVQVPSGRPDFRLAFGSCPDQCLEDAPPAKEDSALHRHCRPKRSREARRVSARRVATFRSWLEKFQCRVQGACRRMGRVG